MIFLDGSQALGNGMRVPVVFDNLIAKHDLPPMIGIFVDPGILPALSDADQNRYNRIFEYDSLSPRFSDFLLDELIPEVAANIQPVEESRRPRPERRQHRRGGRVHGGVEPARPVPPRAQLHRHLRGHEGRRPLPALVRKTEPKPIRIFMQDGTTTTSHRLSLTAGISPEAGPSTTKLCTRP